MDVTVQPDEDDAITDGTGRFTVPDCGCQSFLPSASTALDATCIGRNAAGGTCNHLKSQHDQESPPSKGGD